MTKPYRYNRRLAETNDSNQSQFSATASVACISSFVASQTVVSVRALGRNFSRWSLSLIKITSNSLPPSPLPFAGKRPLWSTSFARATFLNLRKVKPAPRPLASNVGAAGSHMDGAACREGRVPLKKMVEECAQRWFQDALKEAKAGDSAMQVLVAQMYQSGYGVPKNEQKANAWIIKASESRSVAQKARNMHPGYNASDSDSNE